MAGYPIFFLNSFYICICIPSDQSLINNNREWYPTRWVSRDYEFLYNDHSVAIGYWKYSIKHIIFICVCVYVCACSLKPIIYEMRYLRVRLIACGTCLTVSIWTHLICSAYIQCDYTCFKLVKLNNQRTHSKSELTELYHFTTWRLVNGEFNGSVAHRLPWSAMRGLSVWTLGQEDR